MHYITKIRFPLFTALLFSFPLLYLSAQSVAKGKDSASIIILASALEPFYNIGNLPAFNQETTIGQTSSYDTTGGNDDGFSGRYSFVRRRPDSSLVLFDVQGPGVINRIWTPTPSDDSLDFYLDDTTQAAFTILYKDLFSGKVFPFVTPLCNNQLGGYYCYLPIPFQKRCMIVFRGKQTQFYQIGYRSYPRETVVTKFSMSLTATEKTALQKIQTLWAKTNPAVSHFHPDNRVTLQSRKTSFQLKPGDKHTVLQLNKGGRIFGIELDPASAFEGVSKDIDIKITWDNEPVAAVYCPVADFFGYAFGNASMESLLIGTRGNKAYCYFPMPFERSAKIELIYRKSSAAVPVMITAQVFFTPEARNTKKEGKFYTYWNHKPVVPMHQPHEFLNISGKGHYVGTVLQARGLEAGMTGFFEGDDSTVIDGQLRMHGTGSEDYFNGGWYAMMDRWDGPFSLPLSGALDYSLPLSRTGGYRLFLTDKMPFTKSIYHSIEHGPEHNQAPATYTSVAFYYNITPPEKAIPPKAEETRVSMPDTLILYPQLLTLNSAGDIGIRRLWAYPTGGESIILTSPNESAIRIQMPEVPDGNYRVLLDYAKFPQGCTFSLWQRQTPLTDWMDSYATDTARVEGQYLSNLTLTPLNHSLTLRFKTTDTTKNQFFLNRIILVRAKE